MTSHTIKTVDISPFVTETDESSSSLLRTQSGRDLVQALHELGFVKVIGHGVSQNEIDEALEWAKRLFDLPYVDKMKAPHPPGPIPHRGYSGIGKEKVYSKDDIQAHEADGNIGQTIRLVSDFKESYEVGSEQDPVQQNIWLPEDVLPGFRDYMTSLYERLASIGQLVLNAIGVGLGLDEAETVMLQRLISTRHCQLRLLHYPAISKSKLENELLARLPPHHDWGTFTMLFQDSRGGLELQDPQSKDFLHAEPEEGAFVLNVGDMLQRFTNDHFVSALHRVSVPEIKDVPQTGIPPRYSIPFFNAPDFSSTVTTLPRFITAQHGAKYEPINFDQYDATISKYSYKGS